MVQKVLILGSKEFPIGTSDDPIRSGGMEYDINRLAPALVKRGVEVHLITRDDYCFRSCFGMFTAIRDLLNPVAVYRVPWIRGKYLRNYSFNFFSFFKALKVIKKHDIKLVHSVGVVATGVALLLKLLTGVKVFSEPRGLALNSWRFPINFFLGFQERLFYPLCDKVGFQSKEQAEYLEKYLHIQLDNKVIIPTGIDCDVKTNPGKIRKEFNLNGKFVVTFVGRFHVVKGLKYLIEAAWKLPEITFLFVGDGDKLDVPPNVILAGWREDVRDILAASDLFVLPSISEGMPTVLLEALDVGVPCITTLKGTPTCVIPPHDSTAIVKAIRYLKSFVLLRSVREQAGKEFVKTNYSLKKSVSKYLKLYKSINTH